MKNNQIVRGIANVPYLGNSELYSRETAVRTLERLFGLRGYLPLRTPFLERTELFLRKSGGDLGGTLYSFKDPSGLEVSIRPEFTGSVMRYAVERIDSLPMPMRFQYSGTVFRYASPESPFANMPRSFTQVGAELIGSYDSAADAEILAMALEGLETLHVKEPRVVLGHVGMLRDVADQFSLPDRAIFFLFENLLSSERKLNSARQKELVKRAEQLGITAYSNKSNSRLSEDDTRSLISRFVPDLDPNAGVRNRDEIISRLAEKHSQPVDVSRFSSAVHLLCELVNISGQPNEALVEADKCAKESGLEYCPSESLRGVLEVLDEEGIAKSSVHIDFGIARNTSYYTGLLFELRSSGALVGRGGRYDKLAYSIGYDSDMPALGFAYYLDEVLKNSPPSFAKEDKAVVLGSNDPVERADAVRLAKERRKQGKKTVLTFPDAPYMVSSADFGEELSKESDEGERRL